jgi:hypothetical protein
MPKKSAARLDRDLAEAGLINAEPGPQPAIKKTNKSPLGVSQMTMTACFAKSSVSGRQLATLQPSVTAEIIHEMERLAE